MLSGGKAELSETALELATVPEMRSNSSSPLLLQNEKTLVMQGLSVSERFSRKGEIHCG